MIRCHWKLYGIRHSYRGGGLTVSDVALPLRPAPEQNEAVMPHSEAASNQHNRGETEDRPGPPIASPQADVDC